MSVSFEMVKCRNKKYLYCKPTRFALFIRSQSLSAVSEMRVWLDGFVIFMVDACDAPHLGCGQSTYVETFSWRCLLDCWFTYQCQRLCDCVCFSHMTFLTYTLRLACIDSDEKQSRTCMGYHHLYHLYSLKSVEGQYISMQIFIVIKLYCIIAQNCMNNKSQRM